MVRIKINAKSLRKDKKTTFKKDSIVNAAFLLFQNIPKNINANTSLKIATEIIFCPNSVFNFPKSIKILTLTGKAVIEIPRPKKNVAVISKLNSIPTPNPHTNGIIKDITGVIIFLPRKELRISSMLISTPASITKKIFLFRK